MKLSMHTMAVHTFVPMLQSLGEYLDKGAADVSRRAQSHRARLTPDMYTLAQQVQLACYHARNAVERLNGRAALRWKAWRRRSKACRRKSTGPEGSPSLSEAAFEGAEAATARSRSPMT